MLAILEIKPAEIHLVVRGCVSSLAEYHAKNPRRGDVDDDDGCATTIRRCGWGLLRLNSAASDERLCNEEEYLFPPPRPAPYTGEEGNLPRTVLIAVVAALVVAPHLNIMFVKFFTVQQLFSVAYQQFWCG